MNTPGRISSGILLARMQLKKHPSATIVARRKELVQLLAWVSQGLQGSSDEPGWGLAPAKAAKLT